MDSPTALESLSTAMEAANKEVAVLLDLDPGMGRTGIEIGPDAINLYEMIASSPGVKLGGLHWYDGHNRQSDLDERTTAVDVGWN